MSVRTCSGSSECDSRSSQC